MPISPLVKLELVRLVELLTKVDYKLIVTFWSLISLDWMFRYVGLQLVWLAVLKTCVNY